MPNKYKDFVFRFIHRKEKKYVYYSSKEKRIEAHG